MNLIGENRRNFVPIERFCEVCRSQIAGCQSSWLAYDFRLAPDQALQVILVQNDVFQFRKLVFKPLVISPDPLHSTKHLRIVALKDFGKFGHQSGFFRFEMRPSMVWGNPHSFTQSRCFDSVALIQSRLT